MIVSKFGNSPYNIIVVHGGPGAPGEMKPVAEELSKSFGVLEPWQSKDSIKGQIKELKIQIEKYANTPVVLIGYSWGAWLSFLLAAKHAPLVKKLILIGSGPFTTEYAKEITPTRLKRLSEKEKEEVTGIMLLLEKGESSNGIIQKFGALMNKADTFDPADTPEEQSTFQADIYQKVWAEAEKLRSSGELLKEGKNIKCPVIAVHGDYDPHPFEGVRKPLKQVIENFRFILLKNCGHTPWKEKQVKEKFYGLLKKELLKK